MKTATKRTCGSSRRKSHSKRLRYYENLPCVAPSEGPNVMTIEIHPQACSHENGLKRESMVERILRKSIGYMIIRSGSVEELNPH